MIINSVVYTILPYKLQGRSSHGRRRSVGGGRKVSLKKAKSPHSKFKDSGRPAGSLITHTLTHTQIKDRKNREKKMH
jgi:hypothetical protein